MKKFWAAGIALSILVIGLTVGPLGHADGIVELKRLMTGKGDQAAADSSQSVAGTDDATDVADTSVTTDDGIIRLTPDKTKIIYLDQDAGSVIVTNPAHAMIRMDSPRILVIMPRDPGSTSFTVLNRSGKVLMEKSVIVTATEPKYVRIRKVCQANDSSCQEATYFHCPNGCYPVETVPPGDSSDIPPVLSGTGAAAALEKIPDSITPDQKDLYRELDVLKQKNASPQEYLDTLQKAVDDGVLKPEEQTGPQDEVPVEEVPPEERPQ